MGTSEQSSSKPLALMSTLKILIEAFKLPTKNTKQLLPLIIITLLLSSSVYIRNYYSLTPLLTDITTNSITIASLDPTSPLYPSLRAAIVKDLRLLILIESSDLIVSFFISNLLSFTTIHVLSSAYSNNNSRGEQSNLPIKGPFITALCVSLLNLGYLTVVVALSAVCFFALHNASNMLWVAVAVVAVVAQIALLVFYLYLAMAWSVGIVVSVVEVGCYGMEAISKAWRIVGGRKSQTVALVLIQMVMGGVSIGLYSVTKNYLVVPHPSSMVALVGAGVVYGGVGSLIFVYGSAILVVFYCDCNKGEGIVGGFMYTMVRSKIVDEQYP